MATGRRTRERPRLRADRLALEHSMGMHVGDGAYSCPTCWAEANDGRHSYVPATETEPVGCTCGWSEGYTDPGPPYNHRPWMNDRLVEDEHRRSWFAHAQAAAYRREHW